MPSERRAGIDLARARRWTGAPCGSWKGADTTHLTVADGRGNVVCTTQTINSLFGARFIVPGTGMVPNNYMSNFDPAAGQRAVDRAGQAGHHLDVADDGRCGRAGSPMRWACPAAGRSSLPPCRRCSTSSTTA